MIICAGGERGRIVIWRFGSPTPGDKLTLPGTGWIQSLWARNDRLFALSHSHLLARIGLSLEASPEIEAQRDFGRLNVLDVCTLDSRRLAVAGPNGVIICDSENLETIDRVISDIPVRHVRPGGEDALILVDTDGMIMRYSLETKKSELYFGGGWPSPDMVAGLRSSASGALTVALSNGFVAWYDRPGAPAFSTRLADHALSDVAVLDDWRFVIDLHRVLALTPDGKVGFDIGGSGTVRKSALAIEERRLFVLDEEGTLYVFVLDPLQPGVARSPAFVASTGLEYGSTLAVASIEV